MKSNQHQPKHNLSVAMSFLTSLSLFIIIIIIQYYVPYLMCTQKNLAGFVYDMKTHEKSNQSLSQSVSHQPDRQTDKSNTYCPLPYRWSIIKLQTSATKNTSARWHHQTFFTDYLSFLFLHLPQICFNDIIIIDRFLSRHRL